MKRLDQLTQLTAAQLSPDDIIGIRDQSAGQTKYITVKDLTGSPENGWQATGESWTFSSYSSASNTGVVTVPSDATTKYSIGMWVRFAQTTGGTKYGRILSVTSTSLSIWMPGYTLNNEAITSPVYSTVAKPVGLPVTISEGNPYKCSAYMNAATMTTAAATPKLLAVDTKEYDTINMMDVTTNKGRITVPVAGYYVVSGRFRTNGVDAGGYVRASLNKNGATVKSGLLMRQGAGGSTVGSNGGPGYFEVRCAAGDTLEFMAETSNGVNVTGGNANDCYIQCHLISQG